MIGYKPISKSVICKCCGSKIEFTNDDLHIENKPATSLEHQWFILCPNCFHKIIVKDNKDEYLDCVDFKYEKGI